MSQSNFEKDSVQTVIDTLRSIEQEHYYSKCVIDAYVASPWFTEKSEHLLNTFKNLVYSAEDKGELIYDCYFPNEHNYELPSDTYENNVHNINTSSVVIALISEKDVGTAFEIGYAVAKGKKVVLVGYDETCFNKGTNIMLAFATAECITISELYNFLTGKEYKTVDVKDDWSTKQ